MTITFRSSKGSALTYNELDENFNDLNNRTVAGWNDLVSEVTVRSGAANAPTIGNFRDNIYLYQFDPDTTNECFVNFHIRHDYVAGTMVYPHVHWTQNTTSTGVVRFGIEYTLARRGDSTGTVNFGATSTLYIEHNVGTGEQYRHHVNESAEGLGIPGTDLEEDAVILCRVFRDGGHVNDTFPDPVFLITVDVHYQGHTMFTPSRFPPFV